MTDRPGKEGGSCRHSALERLTGFVVELDEERSFEAMEQLLSEKCDPTEILEACIEGMRRVGELFERREYFIAALVMAGEIMRQATALLMPHLGSGSSRPVKGRILLGTIEGDIHDMGKNLLSLLLQANGFKVEDLGVDVPPERFVEAVLETRPDVVGISCVLTLGLERLKTAVELLHTQTAEPRPLVLVGGACIDGQVAKFVGADKWGRNTAEGVRLCREAIAGRVDEKGG